MLEIRPGETVLFPAPYEEDKVIPLIVTTQRVVQMTGDKRQELDARKITFLGRQSLRPLIFLGIFFVLVGLPIAGYGAYLYWSVHDMPSFSEQPPAEENPEFEDPGMVRWKALGFGVCGAILAAVGLLCLPFFRIGGTDYAMVAGAQDVGVSYMVVMDRRKQNPATVADWALGDTFEVGLESVL